MPEADGDSDAVSTRPFWSGTITFGLVSVPVNLLPANRSQGVSLRMVSPEGNPLSRRYFSPQDDRELSADEIVRGYEVEEGSFVVLDDDELERLAPERTRDIDLRVFVPVGQIDPIYFERAYYLTPAGGSTKAYRLLAHAMEEAERAGIATFVMRAKEYLVAILAENGILRAETLRFADEVRTPADVGLPDPIEAPAGQVRQFEKEIEKLFEKRMDTADLVDTSAERLLNLVEQKRGAGEDLVRPEAKADESRDVIDLMQMLQRSLRGGEPAKPPQPNGGGDLSDKSKAELYERAKTLDIPGRSGMSKDELAEAIRRAG
ncbi:MAG: Ku protein [Gemmatimonadota bacterium]